MRIVRSLLFLSLAVILLACNGCNALRVKEVMEGSDAWVREITQGMEITTAYPQNEVVVQQPWEYVVRIENKGKHEPHLNAATVEELNGKTGFRCELLEPETEKSDHDGASWLFFMQPQKVAMNTTTTIRLRCRVTEPGDYRFLWVFDFRESGIAFLSEVTTLHAYRP